MKKIIDIWFADAKSSFERIICLFSALFWTWLEFTFLVFFFTYVFGIAGYVSGGTYQYSWEMMRDNHNFGSALIKVLVLLIFILRVPLYKKKEIGVKKHET